ncbi:beta-class carbonic anhydrase [Sporomusa malonica]|uniref:carbonic anhydrase n=1 Tax=Sporomusa malonica TaxID=112901 RepID=A0A1W2C5M1_9FIRM|nr:carbonic anhydrase [Sporomusa malonica]SMC80314.1 carbonic anhydrase [Sporomusa malonica]
MSMLGQVLQANQDFLEKRAQKERESEMPVSKIPSKNLAIFTCMDTRLVDFLEPALGIERGAAKVIKNAGNTITGLFNSSIRSLLVSIFELDVKEIMVIGHYDCGIAHATADRLISKMLARGICPGAIKMIEKDLETWLDSFHHPVENVKHVVQQIRTNPLIPKDVPIHGLMLDPQTGEIEVIISGYEDISGETCTC